MLHKSHYGLDEPLISEYICTLVNNCCFLFFAAKKPMIIWLLEQYRVLVLKKLQRQSLFLDIL